MYIRGLGFNFLIENNIYVCCLAQCIFYFAFFSDDNSESIASLPDSPVDSGRPTTSVTSVIAKPLQTYFDVKEGLSDSGVCKLCRMKVRFKGVTSNLITHLKVCIVLVYA